MAPLLHGRLRESFHLGNAFKKRWECSRILLARHPSVPSPIHSLSLSLPPVLPLPRFPLANQVTVTGTHGVSCVIKSSQVGLASL